MYQTRVCSTQTSCVSDGGRKEEMVRVGTLLDHFQPRKDRIAFMLLTGKTAAHRPQP